MTIKSKFTYIIVFFCLIIFTGCSIKDAIKSGSDEEILRDRAMTYWDHKLKEEFDKSYEFEYPLYKKQFSVVQYIRTFKKGPVSWTGAAVEKVNIEDDIAAVDMKIRIEMIQQKLQPGLPSPVLKGAASPNGKKFETEALIKEQWVKVDGIWYHVPQSAGGVPSGN